MRRLDNRFGKPMDQAVRHMAVALFNSWRLGGQYCEVGFLILYVSDLQQVPPAMSHHLLMSSCSSAMHDRACAGYEIPSAIVMED